MKKLFTVLFISFIIVSCNDNDSSIFPKEISTEISNEHIRFKGSKVFAKIPKDYAYIENLSRYQKSNNLYVQFIELNNTDFFKKKSLFTKEKLESNGSQVDYLEDVKFNEYEGFIVDGPSKKADERKISLIFGDKDFAVMAVGVYSKDDETGKNEILEIFKNLVYQKNYNLDPFELANFEFDQTITNFKYSSTASNLYIYSESDSANLNNTESNYINIGAFQHMTPQGNKDFLESIANNAKNKGWEIESTIIQDSILGDYSTYTIESEFITKNKLAHLYLTMINNKESSVLFMGVCFNNCVETISKYKKTVKSIKIK